MTFPGTIGVAAAVYAQLLDGVSRSLRASGFKTICLIADHWDSAKPQAEVAARLTREWKRQGVRVIGVSDYYADAAQTGYLIAQGETPASIGRHAGIIDTSELMAIHADGIDLGRFATPSFTFEATGVSGDPTKASAERGRALLDIKLGGPAAVRQIKALAVR